MYTVYNLNEYKNYEEIINLWNKEIGFIFPITTKTFYYNIVNNSTYDRKNSYVALVDGNVVGFIITKLGSLQDDIIEYQNLGWISLFYVSQKERKKGIGSQLLNLVEEGFKSQNATEIVVGKDLHNFFPGIPIDFNNLSTEWFAKRGYNVSRQTHDLISKAQKLPTFTIKNLNQFQFRLANITDEKVLIDFVKNNFSNRWAYEVRLIFQKPTKGNQVLICLDKDDIIAFCIINDSKEGNPTYNTVWNKRFDYLGGIGPLGVRKDKRHIGLGMDIVAWSCNYLKNKGVSDIIIDWTGLISFYQKLGFEVWKSYFYTSKKF